MDKKGRGKGARGERATQGRIAPQAPVYLDNAATTLAAPGVAQAMVEWLNRGNPSSAHASALEARAMVDKARAEVAAELGVEAVAGARGSGGVRRPGKYYITFTSGASESNSAILVSAARAYAAHREALPTIVVSEVEHSSVLRCCEQLEADRLARVVRVPVASSGPGMCAVDPRDLHEVLQNTESVCLVSIIAANNVTGVRNDLQALAEVAHRRGAPFHTDATQLFAKDLLLLADLGVDALSASFHKLHGPPGVGLLAVSADFADGFHLGGHVAGPQQFGLRGGTENVPGIAAARVALRHTLANRAVKNRATARRRDAAWAALGARLVACTLSEFLAVTRKRAGEGGCDCEVAADAAGAPALEKMRAAARAAEAADRPVVVWIAPGLAPGGDNSAPVAEVLPGTLLLGVHRRGFCNIAARAALERRGVIVGVGSACDSVGAKAGPQVNHVIMALDCVRSLRESVLRVSLGDDTTDEDVGRFLKAFAAVVESDECLRTSARKSKAG